MLDQTMADGRPGRTGSSGRTTRATAAWLLGAVLLAGCKLPGPAGAHEALPLSMHLLLAEVVVTGRSEGPIRCAPESAGWDGQAPATLHTALRDGVAAEARRLGLARTRTVEAAPESTPVASTLLGGEVTPGDDVWDGTEPGAAASPIARLPPPGTAWLDVWLQHVDFTRTAGDEGPVHLSARFEAAVTVGRPPLLGDQGWSPLVARQAFTLIDELPRPPEAWAADEGAATRAGLARLVGRAARRISVALLATAESDRPWQQTGRCGLATRRPPPSASATGKAPPAMARWEAWTPSLPRDAAVEYDLRAWRLDAWSEPVPAMEADGLTQLNAPLAPPGVPAATYAWTVRGVASLPGGRRVATPWSLARPDGDSCASEPEPGLASVLEVPGPRAAPPLPAPGGPKITATYAPMRWAVKREGLGPDVNAGTGAVQGIGAGVKGGFQFSFACGPFFPVCAAFAVPAGMLIGAGAGMVVGGVSSAVASTYRAEEAELADGQVRTALAAALARLAARPALLATVQASTQAALPPPGGEVALDAIEVLLIGRPAPDHPATLRLHVAGTLTRAGAPPLTRRVEVAGGDALPARLWAEGSGAALGTALEAQAELAGQRLAAAFAAPDPAPAQAPEASRPPAEEPPSAW